MLGGEQSGHVIFLQDSPAGDGLLTAVKIASLVSMHGKLESLIEGLKDYPQVIVNVKVKSKPPLESLPQVAKALDEAQTALGENGRIVLRYSGTEPLARVMVEAEHQADVQRFSQSVADALRVRSEFESGRLADSGASARCAESSQCWEPVWVSLPNAGCIVGGPVRFCR